MTKAIAIFDMPHGCGYCQLSQPWSDRCGITGKDISDVVITERKRADCPLIEVDDHKAEIITSKPEKPNVIPISVDRNDGKGKRLVRWFYTCGRCGEMVIKDRPYCPSCGAEIDWSENDE